MAKEPNQKVITKKHLARLEKERIQQRYLMIGAIVVIVLVVAIVVYGILDQTVIKAQRPVAKVGSRIDYYLRVPERGPLPTDRRKLTS